MILVTGASGNVGTELIKLMSQQGEAVRAFVRSRTRAGSLALRGVELFEGDFSKPESFKSALKGVDRLFLLIPSSGQVEQQQRNFVQPFRRTMCFTQPPEKRE